MLFLSCTCVKGYCVSKGSRFLVFGERPKSVATRLFCLVVLIGIDRAGMTAKGNRRGRPRRETRKLLRLLTTK